MLAVGWPTETSNCDAGIVFCPEKNFTTVISPGKIMPKTVAVPVST